MSLSARDTWEGYVWPKPCLYRPTVYNPMPFLNGPKHDFLAQCLPTVNPLVLARILDRLLPRMDPLLHHRRPPLLGLQEAVPNIYAPKFDPTRSREAFLRRKLPKLRRDLNGDRKTVSRTLYTLADVVHDPERVPEAVRVHIPKRIVKIMYSKRPWVRERCLSVLETMASTAIGRDAILLEPNCLHGIKVLAFDEYPAVRFRAALALRMLVFFRIGPYDMDEFDLAPFLLYVVRWEDDPCVITVHLFSLKLLLELNETKEMCISHGGFEIMEEFMRTSHHGMAGGAMEVMARFTSCPKGEKLADQRAIVHNSALRSHIFSDDIELASSAALLVMYLTLSEFGKKAATENGFHEALFLLVGRADCDRCMIVAYQALANMSEYAPCRKRLLELDEELSTIKIPDKEINNIRIRLLALMHWVALDVMNPSERAALKCHLKNLRASFQKKM